jgi:hypothetical protein
MEADPSLPGWGEWYALPPSTGGGRTVIHHLADWCVGAHVCNAEEETVGYENNPRTLLDTN